MNIETVTMMQFDIGDINDFSAREKFLLHLADNGLIMNHRLCEWCAHAPQLELEMGLANIGLDHLGQARLWLNLLNDALVARGVDTNEDALAYFRDDTQYFNLLLVEMPNDDFAMTAGKLFLYDAFHRLALNQLSEVDEPSIAAVAEKASIEVDYHLRFSTHWMRVMVDGSEESARRMRDALDELWPLCGEFFSAADFETAARLRIDFARLKDAWLASVLPELQPLGLALDEALPFHHPSGKHNRHTEHLGYLLAEMQVLARRHPGATW